MRERSDNSSKLFLTELMIAIFFFSLITAVCVQLFVEAHSMSIQSEKMTQAVNVAANVAECYNSWDFEKDSWQENFPEGIWEGNTWKICFDAEWKQCVENGKYLLEMQLEENGALWEANIIVKDSQEKELYSLVTKRVRGE